MVDIEFHPIAKEDIKELYDYLSRYSLEYADSFVEGFYDRIEYLKEFPELGRKYPENENYHQLIYQNYRILYKYNKVDVKIIITGYFTVLRNQL